VPGKVHFHVICGPVNTYINPLNAELNSICHLQALLEAYHIPNTLYVNLFALESKLKEILINSQETSVNWRHLKLGSPKIDKEQKFGTRLI
jgi:hypothetical protein